MQFDAFCTSFSRSHCHSRCREPAGHCKETHSRAARDACGRCLACCSVPQLRDSWKTLFTRHGTYDPSGTWATKLRGNECHTSPERWTTIPADTLAFRTGCNLCSPISVAIQEDYDLIDSTSSILGSLDLCLDLLELFLDFCSQCLAGAVEIDPQDPRCGTWGGRVHLRSFGRRWDEVPCEAMWVTCESPVFIWFDHVFYLENPSAFKATFERFGTCLCRIEATRLQRCCLHRLPDWCL